MTDRPTSPTANRRSREKARRRAAILDAALELLRASGIENLQIEEIAQRTELAKGTLYRYFKSKNEVLTELLLEARARLLISFEQVIAKHDTVLGQLEAIIWANYDYCVADPNLYELMFFYESTITEAELQARLMPSSEPIIKLIVDVLEQGVQEKVLQPDLDTLEFSFQLYATVTGMLKMLFTREDLLERLGKTTKEVFEQFSRRTLRSILA